VYDVLCTVYDVLCTVYDVPCMVYDVLCTVPLGNLVITALKAVAREVIVSL